MFKEGTISLGFALNPLMFCKPSCERVGDVRKQITPCPNGNQEGEMFTTPGSRSPVTDGLKPELRQFLFFSLR